MPAPLSATYSDPTLHLRDKVRLLCGDTDVTQAGLQDREIAALAADYGVTAAQLLAAPTGGRKTALVIAAACADAIAAKLRSGAPAGGFSLGDYSETGSRAEALDELAKKLRKQAGAYARPRFTGQSVSAAEALDEASDLVQPTVRRGMHDHPGGSSGFEEGEE